MRIRTINFNAYHRSKDPLATASAAFKSRINTTKITATRSPPLHYGQALNYPDETLWKTAHNDELDLLDNINTITWIPSHQLPSNTLLIPLTIKCRYKRDSNGQITK